MGAGKLYDDGLTTPHLPGRENDAAAGGGPAPTPPLPAAAPLPGMARALRSLHYSWDRVYVLAACVMPDRSEVWTAVSHDGGRVITAAGWVDFAVALRADHGRYDTPDTAPPAADYALTRIRRAFPGFAIITEAGHARAYRGADSWPPPGVPAVTLPVLGNLLADQVHQDARLTAQLMGA
jgi:hypothetical protein